jgi:predicted nucleotidyltransferase
MLLLWARPFTAWYNAGQEPVMNVHQIDRRILLTYLHAVEDKFPLRFVGLLERGSAPHISGGDAVDLLAEKREGLSLLGLAKAEVELSDRLGRPVGIVLRSELHGGDETRLLAGLRPL